MPALCDSELSVCVVPVAPPDICEPSVQDVVQGSDEGCTEKNRSAAACPSNESARGQSEPPPMPARRVSCLDDDDYDWQMMDQESQPTYDIPSADDAPPDESAFPFLAESSVRSKTTPLRAGCLVTMILMCFQIRHLLPSGLRIVFYPIECVLPVLLHVILNWGRGQVGTVSDSLRALRRRRRLHCSSNL